MKSRAMIRSGVRSLLLASLSAAAAARADVLVQYTFDTPAGTSNATTVAPNIQLASPITNGTGNATFSTTLSTYTTYVLQMAPSAAAPYTTANNPTNVVDANTRNAYMQFTLQPTNGFGLNLSSLTLKAAKGGASTQRGWGLQTSVGGLSANKNLIVAQADVLTVRPTLTNFTVDLSGAAYQGLTGITFRIYNYSPGSGSTVEYDDITVNGAVQVASGAAPVISLQGGASNVSSSSANVYANLSSTGTAATAVTVFWGKADQYPSTNGWDGSYSFGNNVSPSPLMATATGLVGYTPYYYRFFATNSVGTCWTGQGTFTTPADIPVFTSVSATPVGAGTSATLSGTVTGIAPITVTAFWGLTDGNTTTVNWANSTNIGVVAAGSAGSGTATGLTLSTTYYYRFMGSNTAGIGWSASGTTFRTYNNAVLTWTNTAATGSWGTPGNWDHPPLFDGTEDALCGVASTATINSTLDGDRKVNSLSLGGGYAFTLAAGTNANSSLILMSGNLTETNTAGWGNINVPIQVGDGITPVSNAVWYFNLSAGPGQQAQNRILGVAGSLITLTNKTTSFCPAFLANNATNYFGDWVLCGNPILVRADNALGLGRITMQNAAGIYNGVAGSQNTGTSVVLSNDIVLAGALVQFCVWTNTATPMTLAGNLSGTGIVVGAGSDKFYGALKIAGTNNSASGGCVFNKVINSEGFQIVLVGTWTNAGTFDLAVQYGFGASLQGNGFLGLGLNKKVTMSSTSQRSMFIAPSDGTPLYSTGSPLLLTNGTIGTLTIGTPGNHNSVEFPTNSWLLATVNATTSSTLVVNGLLNIFTNAPFGFNALTINGTLSRMRTYTLAQFTSRSNKFTNVYWYTNQVANPETKGAINGTHTLVYSATDIQLVSCAQRGAVIFVR